MEVGGARWEIDVVMIGWVICSGEEASRRCMDGRASESISICTNRVWNV